MTNEATPILQAKCDWVIQQLSASIQHRCPVTLIAFYNNGSAEGTAFSSSLTTLELLVSTLEARVSRWCGAPAPPHAVNDWSPSSQEMTQLAEQCRDGLPLSACFAIICGSGHDHAYASFASNEDMLKFFHEQVLPHLKARQAVAAGGAS